MIPQGEGGIRARIAGVLRGAALVAWKDLAAEVRRRDLLVGMVFFGVMELLIFQFALDLDLIRMPLVSAGILWVAAAFAGLLGLGRSFAADLENRALEGVILTPLSLDGIFLGKCLSNTVYLIILETVLTLAASTLLGLDLVRSGLPLLTILFLGAVGFSILATLFAALTSAVKAREVLLPLLLLPLVVPWVLSVVRATEVALAGEPLAQAARWIKLLAGFDMIVLVVSLLMAEWVLPEAGG